MQKSNDMVVAKNVHRHVKSSTTLNRKYVKRPAKNTDNFKSTSSSPTIRRFSSAAASQTAVAKGSATITRIAKPTQSSTNIVKTNQKKPTRSIDIPAQDHPIQTVAKTRMQTRTNAKQIQVSKLSAQELKEKAIKKALSAANNTPTMAEQITQDKKQKKTGKLHFGLSRVILALSCAAAAAFAIVYFVNLNVPDISLKVAAMQTGINASYPGYVPRDFKLSGITSENNKVTLNFSKKSDENFTLTEEKSPWDSNALLTNFVKEAYGENYTIIREQGLTIYVSGSNAAWVNGGMMFKITAEENVLTQKQIRSICVSL